MGYYFRTIHDKNETSPHKNKTSFGECYTYFGCETKTGVVRILVIFQGRPMFSHVIEKVLVRAFY